MTAVNRDNPLVTVDFPAMMTRTSGQEVPG